MAESRRERGQNGGALHALAQERLASMEARLAAIEQTAQGEGDLATKLRSRAQAMLGRVAELTDQFDEIDVAAKGADASQKRGQVYRDVTALHEQIEGVLKAAQALATDEAEAQRQFDQIEKDARAGGQGKSGGKAKRERTKPERGGGEKAARGTATEDDGARGKEDEPEGELPGDGASLYLAARNDKEVCREARFVRVDETNPRRFIVIFSPGGEEKSLFRDQFLKDKPAEGVESAFPDSPEYKNPLEKLGLTEGQTIYVPIPRSKNLLEVRVESAEGNRVYYWDGRTADGQKVFDWVFADKITVEKPTDKAIVEFQEVEVPPFEEGQTVYLPRQRGNKTRYEEVVFFHTLHDEPDKASVGFGEKGKGGKRWPAEWRTLLKELPAGETPISQDPTSPHYEKKEVKELKPGETVYHNVVKGDTPTDIHREGRVERVEGTHAYVWFGKMEMKSGKRERKLSRIPVKSLRTEKPDGVDVSRFIEERFAPDERVYAQLEGETEYREFVYLGVNDDGTARFDIFDGKQKRVRSGFKVQADALLENPPAGAKVKTNDPDSPHYTKEGEITEDDLKKAKLIYLKKDDKVNHKGAEYTVNKDPEIEYGAVKSIQLKGKNVFTISALDAIQAIQENLPEATRLELVKRERATTAAPDKGPRPDRDTVIFDQAPAKDDMFYVTAPKVDAGGRPVDPPETERILLRVAFVKPGPKEIRLLDANAKTRIFTLDEWNAFPKEKTSDRFPSSTRYETLSKDGQEFKIGDTTFKIGQRVKAERIDGRSVLGKILRWSTDPSDQIPLQILPDGETELVPIQRTKLNTVEASSEPQRYKVFEIEGEEFEIAGKKFQIGQKVRAEIVTGTIEGKIAKWDTDPNTTMPLFLSVEGETNLIPITRDDLDSVEDVSAPKRYETLNTLGEEFEIAGKKFQIGQRVKAKGLFGDVEGMIVSWTSDPDENLPLKILTDGATLQEPIQRSALDTVEAVSTPAVEKFEGEPVPGKCYVLGTLVVKVISIDAAGEGKIKIRNLRYDGLNDRKRDQWKRMIEAQGTFREAAADDYILNTAEDDFEVAGKEFEIGKKYIDSTDGSEVGEVVTFVMGPEDADRKIIFRKASGEQHDVSNPANIVEAPPRKREYIGFDGDPRVDKIFVIRFTTGAEECPIVDPELIPADSYQEDRIYFRTTTGVRAFPREDWNKYIGSGAIKEKPTASPDATSEKFEGEPGENTPYKIGSAIFNILEITPDGEGKVRTYNCRTEQVREFTRDTWGDFVRAEGGIHVPGADDYYLREDGEGFIFKTLDYTIGEKFSDPDESREEVTIQALNMTPGRRAVQIRYEDGREVYITNPERLEVILPGLDADTEPDVEPEDDVDDADTNMDADPRETYEIFGEIFEDDEIGVMIAKFTRASLEEDERLLDAVKTDLQNIFDVGKLSAERRADLEIIAVRKGYENLADFIDKWKENGWKIAYNVIDGMVAHDLLGKINADAELQAILQAEVEEEAEKNKQYKGIKGWIKRVVANAGVPVLAGLATAGLVAWLSGGVIPLMAAAGGGTGTLTQRLLERSGFLNKGKKRKEARERIYARIKDEVIESQRVIAGKRFEAVLWETMNQQMTPGSEGKVHAAALGTMIDQLQDEITLLETQLPVVPDADKPEAEQQILELKQRRTMCIADRALLIHKENNPAISYTQEARAATNKSAYFSEAWKVATQGVEDSIIHGKKWNLYSADQKKVWLGHLAAVILNAGTAAAVAAALPGLGFWSRAAVRGGVAFAVKGTEAALHERSRFEGDKREKIRQAQVLLAKGDRDSIYAAERILVDAYKTAKDSDLVIAGLKKGGIAAGVGAGFGAGVDVLRSIGTAVSDLFDKDTDTNVIPAAKASPASESQPPKAEVKIPASEPPMPSKPKVDFEPGDPPLRTNATIASYPSSQDPAFPSASAPAAVEVKPVLNVDTSSEVAATYTAKRGDGFENILNNWEKDPDIKEQIIDSLRETKKSWVDSALMKGRAMGLSGNRLEQYVDDRLLANWEVEFEKQMGVINRGAGKSELYTKTLYPNDVATLTFDPEEGPIVEVTRADGSELPTHKPYSLGKNIDTPPLVPDEKEILSTPEVRIPIVQNKTELHTLDSTLKMYPDPSGNGFMVELPDGRVLHDMIIEDGKYLVPRAGVSQNELNALDLKAYEPTAAKEPVGLGTYEKVGNAPASRAEQIQQLKDRVFKLGAAQNAEAVEPPPSGSKAGAKPFEAPEPPPSVKPAAGKPEIVPGSAGLDALAKNTEHAINVFNQFNNTELTHASRLNTLREYLSSVKGQNITYKGADYSLGTNNNVYFGPPGNRVLVTADNMDAISEFHKLTGDNVSFMTREPEIRAKLDEIYGRESVAPQPEWKVEWPQGLGSWMEKVAQKDMSSFLDTYSEDQINRIVAEVQRLDKEIQAAHQSSNALAQAQVLEKLEDLKTRVESGRFN